MPRRVLYVSHVQRLGGAERSLLDLLDGLDPARFAAHVALPGDGELADALTARAIPWEACPGLGRLHRSVLRAPAGLAGLVRGSRALRAIEDRLRPDLVHANSTTAALFGAGLSGRAGRPPLVWHVRDLAIPALVGARVARASARVVVPSKACRDAALAVAEPGRIEVVANGIDPTPVRAEDPAALRRELGAPDGMLAVSVGQMVPWKGHDLAIEAVRLAREKAPELRLAIVGADLFGDDPMVAGRLERQILEGGLEDVVRLVGWRDDVRAILDAADLLLHAAWPEPFGRVVLEAMAAARPVLAFDGAHGPAEIVRNGVDGILVERRTVGALAIALARLCWDPESLEELGASGRRRVEECYDRRETASRVQEIYDGLLDGRSG